MVVYRSISFAGLFRILVEAAELSAVVLMIIGIAFGVRLGGQHARHLRCRGEGTGRAALERVADAAVDQPAAARRRHVPRRDLDLPDPAALLVPIAVAMGWDLVWFGVMMTINLAIGQFTPPMAIS